MKKIIVLSALVSVYGVIGEARTEKRVRVPRPRASRRVQGSSLRG